MATYVITALVNVVVEEYHEADEYADEIYALLDNVGYDVESVEVEESLPSI